MPMQLWDTAGQERYRAITRSYYRRAHAAIIAYDITQRSSFESVPYLVEEVKKYGDTNLVIMLMGTKSDLWEKRQVLFEEACAMAEKHGLLAALETSAKESRNINEVFQFMAKALIARNSQPVCGDSAPSSLPQSTTIVLAPSPQAASDQSQCTC
ncbi:ras-related protein Rab-19-like [Sorex araneus]|uniref:ras-related protein Rab-19-like n=1 Tax=Sorex araneus TaxID=42254 RepID=UPI002433A894|nr:ras-related protein Rab-19-like [Sorex araneus]